MQQNALVSAPNMAVVLPMQFTMQQILVTQSLRTSKQLSIKYPVRFFDLDLAANFPNAVLSGLFRFYIIAAVMQ